MEKTTNNEGDFDGYWRNRKAKNNGIDYAEKIKEIIIAAVNQRSLSYPKLRDLALNLNDKYSKPFTSQELMIMVELAWDSAEPMPEDSQTQMSRLRLLKLDDIYAAPDPVELIQTVILKHSLILLAGYLDSGKSLLAQNIVFSLLNKSALFGKYEVIEKQPQRAFIIDEENGSSILKQRLSKIGFADHSISYLHFQGIKVDDDVIFQDLMDLIHREKPTIIVFDSLIRFHSKEENSNSDMPRVMEKFRQIVNHGITCIVIHHNGKGEYASKKKNARGASDIPGACDMCLEIEEKQDYFVFSNLKNRLAEKFRPIKLKLNKANLQFEFAGYLESEGQETINELHKILAIGKLDIDTILNTLNANGIEIGITRLRALIKADSKNLVIDTGIKGKKLYGLKAAYAS